MCFAALCSSQLSARGTKVGWPRRASCTCLQASSLLQSCTCLHARLLLHTCRTASAPLIPQAMTPSYTCLHVCYSCPSSNKWHRPPSCPHQAMTYFLCYTERPEAPVPRLATTGELGACCTAINALRPCCCGMRWHCRYQWRQGLRRVAVCAWAVCRPATYAPPPRPCLTSLASCPALPSCRRGQAGAHVGRGQLEALCQGAAPAEGGVPLHRLGALGRHRTGPAPLPAAGDG